MQRIDHLLRVIYSEVCTFLCATKLKYLYEIPFKCPFKNSQENMLNVQYTKTK